MTDDTNANIQEMKAAIRRTYGLPNKISIENIKRPVPKDNEVLIKIYSTTVNRTDCANLTGKPFIMRVVLGLLKPRQIVLGTDFAGKVVSLGKNVKSFEIGDKVFGFSDMGLASQAEYITMADKNIFRIPANVNFKHAAASLEGAHYAYSFIHRVNIQFGQNILINGATGGIGSALLQFVRQYNVHITATCNTKNIELIKSLGADKIYDYTKEDFAGDKEKYDLILDAVGKSTFGKCKPLLKENGIYMSSELGPYSQNLLYSILSSIANNKKVIFPVPFRTQKTIPYIVELLKEEKFRPVIDREYSLEDINMAYEYVLLGQKTGSVVINI